MLIEADLAERGTDLGDSQLLAARSWRWLRARILGLLSVPTSVDAAGRTVYATRLQEALRTSTPDVAQREEG